MSCAYGQTHNTSIEFSELMKLMEQADERGAEDADYMMVNVTVDFASSQVFRGSSSEQFAVQPGIEVWGLGLPEKYGHINVGVWGNVDMNDNGSSSNRFEFSEIDWYGTYYLPEVVENLYLFIGLIQYIYPTEATPANQETNVGIEYWLDSVALGATAYFGVGGDTRGDNYYDVSASYYIFPTPKIIASFDVLAGYFQPDGGPSGWNEGVIGCSAEYALGEVWSVGVTVAYIVQFYDSVYYEASQGEALDDYLFGMLGFSAAY